MTTTETAVHQIENILSIKLSRELRDEPPKNWFSERKEGIEQIQLDNVVLTCEIVDQLLPHLKALRRLNIRNARVSNLGLLLKFQVYYLDINNVVFEEDRYDPSIIDGLQLEVTPGEVHLKNSRFNASGLLDFRRLTFLFITNCQVDNYHALNELPNLYQLEFKQVNFNEDYDRGERSINDHKQILLKLQDCTISNLNCFLPFASRIGTFNIVDSSVHNITAIGQFVNMHRFSVNAGSTLTVAEDGAVTQPDSSIQWRVCEYIGDGNQVNLECLSSVADLFNVLRLENCNTKEIIGVSLFKQVKHLDFSNCELYLGPLRPIAHQILAIDFTDTVVYELECWEYFTQLTSVKVVPWNDNKGLGGLQPLLPLKNQLKRLSFWEDTAKEALDCIGEFRALEVLAMNPETITAVQAIFSLSSLKRLKTTIHTEEKLTIDLSQLTALEHLEFCGLFDCTVTGLGHLTHLTTLELEEVDIDINTLPKMPQLKRLHFDGSEYEVKGLSQFPQLEELKVGGAKKIRLKGLHKLKVLDLSNNIYLTEFNCFDDLPVLEKLSLSELYCENSAELIDLKQLKNLKELKWLSLMESEMNSLEGIEALTQLEYLDLYQTGITNVEVLNHLKCLKEVNLATDNHTSRFELQAQLNRPEIAQFLGLPRVHFRIWEDVELWEDYYV